MTATSKDFFSDLSDENFDRVSAMDAEEIKRIAHVANGGERLVAVSCNGCGGTGWWKTGYRCFKCKGAGKLTKGQAAQIKGKATQEANAAQWRADNADLVAGITRHAQWNRIMQEMLADINDNRRLEGRRFEVATEMVARFDAQDAERAAARNAEREAKSGEVDISAIEALFARAVSNDVKRPIFRTEHVTLKQARNGAIYVEVTGSSYGEGYLGKIIGGKFNAARLATPETLEQLRAIAVDPQAEAVKYGRLTSCCGICGRGLVDPISIRTGIGPICAERFGFVFAREISEQQLVAEANEQAARPDALPADLRAKGVAKATVARTPSATTNEIKAPKEGGLCWQAWKLFDDLYAELGTLPATATIVAGAAHRKLNVGNVKCEFPRWKRFHGHTK